MRLSVGLACIAGMLVAIALWSLAAQWHPAAHAAGTHFVHFASPTGDVWIDATKVEAVDTAQTGYTYQTRISTQQHTYMVAGSVTAAEAALNAALP